MCLRFARQQAQRRPTGLVGAYNSFRKTYGQVCGPPTCERNSYVPVLGFDEPEWTKRRENLLVNVLLQLTAHGIVPASKLHLEGLLALPELPFLASVPSSPAQFTAKRLRLLCAGGGRVWTLLGPMLASHGPLAFAQVSGLVATHRGRLEGFCSAEFELNSALEETQQQVLGVEPPSPQCTSQPPSDAALCAAQARAVVQ